MDTSLTRSLYCRQELQVEDREGRLTFYTNGTLSPEKRDQLEHGLNVWADAVRPTLSGADWVSQDNAQSAKNEFSAFHFSYYSHYGAKVSKENLKAFSL